MSLRNLPNISEPLASISNRLTTKFSGVRTEVEGYSAHWQLEPQFPLDRRFGEVDSDSTVKILIQLVTDSDSLLLSMDNHALAHMVGNRHWWDYEPQHIVLSWTLAHTNFLNHFEQLTQKKWHVQQIGDTQIATDTYLHINWNVKFDDYYGQGKLLATQDLLQILNQPAYQALTPKELPKLNFQFEILATPILMLPNEINAFNPGDILLLNKKKCFFDYLFLRTNSLSFAAHVNDRMLCISEVNNAYSNEKGFTRMMSSENDNNQELPFDVNSVPIKMEFKIGEIQLSLAELQNIGPGYIVNLKAPLDDAKTDIYANGNLIAKGQLITVGDQVGIRILRFSHNGF